MIRSLSLFILFFPGFTLLFSQEFIPPEGQPTLLMQKSMVSDSVRVSITLPDSQPGTITAHILLAEYDSEEKMQSRTFQMKIPGKFYVTKDVIHCMIIAQNTPVIVHTEFRNQFSSATGESMVLRKKHNQLQLFKPGDPVF